jgi:hypothetical protein
MTRVRKHSTTRRGRLTAAILLAVMAILATAVPAFGHASFPGYSAFGFAPNTSGGTGLPGSTPPYAANTEVTIHTRVPFEQTEPHNGSDDTTVDVEVIVPDGWTGAECGAARKQINDDTTNFTNQPGDAVAGWTCAITSEDDHEVLHWSGPQVVSPATAADSAQFFTFSVTTPSPVEQTTYNGAAGSGTEGFIVDQEYASGEIKYWIPHADFPGSPPIGAESVVAGGLARTVAATCGEDATGPFPDVPGESIFCEDIHWMAIEEITGGFSDGTFRPTNPVVRQQMAAFLYRYEGEPTVTLTEPFFADVAESSQFYDAIQWMAESGLSVGTPQPTGKPLFNPTSNVSRQAMAAFLYRNAGEPTVTLTEPFFADVPETSGFYEPIQWMAETELAVGTPQPVGDPLYKPLLNVSRQTMSAFLHRYDELP